MDRSRVRRIVFWVAASLALVGCDDEVDETAEEAIEEPSEPAAEPVAPLELHEWGLISERLGEEERVATRRAPARSIDWGSFGVGATVGGEGIGESVGISGSLPMRSGGKPVVYAHLPDGVDERAFELEVRVPGGQVVEHWPRVAEGQPEALRWTARAHRGECGERRYPEPGDPACQTPDDFCEAALAPADSETEDGACLEVGGASFDYLFYRAGMPPTPLPLAITRAEDGGLRIEHRGEVAIPGRLIHVRRGATRAASVFRLLDPPAPGTTATLTPLPDAPADAPDAARALHEDAAALGLSADEVDAFGRAWDVELLGRRAEGSETAQQTPFPPSLATPAEALLYWMPPAELDAHLALVPSEDVVLKRAILVRVGLEYAEAGEGGDD